MIRILSWILVLLYGATALAQQPDRYAPFGDLHTPKGRLHALVLYVVFEDDTVPHPTWPIGQIPDFARDDAHGNNDLFSRHPEQIGQRENISDWLYEMSGGRFVMTGHVLQKPLVAQRNNNPSANSRTNRRYATQTALSYLRDSVSLPWADFDRRTNQARFQRDNSETPPDGILDYVLVFFRDGPLGAHSGGAASLYSSTVVADSTGEYRISHGFTIAHTGTSAPHFRMACLHEMAHNFFRCPHYGSANQAIGNRFYTHNAWGIMNGTAPLFNVMNGWERWYLDWLTPQEATEGVNHNFTINDYMTEGDALRIPIPHAPGQYLWIENHQKRHRYDDKIFYPQNPVAPGLYAYVTAAGHDRTRPVGYVPTQTNFFRTYPASGHFDYIPLKEEVDGWRVMVRGAPNPIGGLSPISLIRADLHGSQPNTPPDGRIKLSEYFNGGKSANEQQINYAERVDGKLRRWSFSGDSTVAFRRVGEGLGLGGVTPVLNLPVYDQYRYRFSPQYLNGLSVTVVGHDAATGAYRISVRYDNTTVPRDTRWTGNLVLRDVPGTTDDLRVMPEATLTLDKSGTPNRHVLRLPGDFINLTQLQSDSGADVRVQGSIVITDSTVWTLTPGATLRIDRGGEVILRDGGTLRVEGDPTATLKLARGGQLRVAAGGRLEVPANYLPTAEQKGVRVQAGTVAPLAAEGATSD